MGELTIRNCLDELQTCAAAGSHIRLHHLSVGRRINEVSYTI